jgi:hypothetical protein
MVIASQTYSLSSTNATTCVSIRQVSKPADCDVAKMNSLVILSNSPSEKVDVHLALSSHHLAPLNSTTNGFNCVQHRVGTTKNQMHAQFSSAWSSKCQVEQEHTTTLVSCIVIPQL